MTTLANTSKLPAEITKAYTVHFLAMAPGVDCTADAVVSISDCRGKRVPFDLEWFNCQADVGN